MKNKYFNDAVVGNKNMVASFSKKGELLRLYYPQTDYKQFIDFMDIGMKVNDSGMIYFHDDVNNVYEQHYVEDTNILTTNIFNSYFKVRVNQTDFVPIRENVLIKKYVFQNQNSINLNINLLLHSKLLNNTNNKVSGMFKDNSLMQYTHDYTLAIVSKTPALSFQINDTQETIKSGVIGGKDYIGMSEDSSISYDIGELKPGEEKEIDLIIVINPNRDSNLVDKLAKAKKIDLKSELEHTKKYWRKFVKEHTKIDLKEEQNAYLQKIAQIYKRSILLFPLLENDKTGGISAAVEVDENLTKCGRYSYCWPRDAVFITNALDLLGMEKETQKFYEVFCKKTQSKSGRWEQRFYTDGNLAPCWGYQIDETAAVVYGVYNHYLHTKDKDFLKNTFKMCEKAVQSLEKYLDEIFDGKNMPESYDLWEMNEGIHTYSLASIFGALEAMQKIYDLQKPEFENNRLKLEQINKEENKIADYLIKLKDYIVKNFYDENKKSFVRHEDGRMDISLLGLVYPFKVFEPKEKKIENTIENIQMTLRTYTGGYLRFEKDHYCNGNPWPIANLWLANYYLDKGEKKKAEECFSFVVKSANQHGFLPEQVDNSTMQPAWVIGLGWSHAMFITTLERLSKKN